MLLLIFLIGFLTLYINTSYGLFKKKDYLTSIDFVAGTLDYKIESDVLNNNSITVPANGEFKFNIKLTSLNSIDSKYELYYLIDGEKVTNNDIEIGYTEDSIDSVKGTINSNGAKNITVSIKNNGNKSVYITFGCEGGLINNELIMVKGNSLDTLIVDGDVMLAYTYSGTGTKPTKFPSINDGYYVTDLTCTGGTAVWDNNTWTMKITETSGQSISCNANIIDMYRDNSGASIPVIKGDLIPVIISDTGGVTKANIGEEWYNYDQSIWANAIILNDGYGPYNDGDTIPEEAIESYFVWIPRYRYKIFDEGKYTALGSKEASEQPIEIEFESNTTPTSTGSSEGTWLTHPAFTSFDNTNGFWVGKFESGYRGATSTEGAQQDVTDSSKLIIKPNAYSWRNIAVGNAFKTSYDYNRGIDSHMMKNTEWGAVTYLSHSKYGHIGSVRINNNINYVTGYSATEEPTKGYNESSISGNRQEKANPGVDGIYTVNYYNTSSIAASTTNNYSGIYDMSGGAWEYVMGNINNTSGSSEIASIISDFYTNITWTKYYDKYSNQTSHSIFNNRILGDATGEMGPFFSQTDPDGSKRNKSSWYGDYAFFINSSYPWFRRGGIYYNGTLAGTCAFFYYTGASYNLNTFRVVLTPQ